MIKEHVRTKRNFFNRNQQIRFRKMVVSISRKLGILIIVVCFINLIGIAGAMETEHYDGVIVDLIPALKLLGMLVIGWLMIEIPAKLYRGV